jgi:uncharacterized protein (TIGR04255 family)
MSSNLSYALTKIQFGQITESTFTKNSDLLIEELGEEYPIFVSEKVEQIEMRFNANTHEQSSIKTQIPIITLLSAGNDWGVKITQEHILLHTNAYISYEDFEAKVSSILKAMKKIMGLRHLAFAGLRYLNKFNEENFSTKFERTEFLQPEFETLRMAGSNMASHYIDDKYGINVNSGVTVDSTKYPPDLAELIADLKIKNPVLNGAWAHLDIDVYLQEQKLIPYEHDKVIEILSELRSRAKTIYTSIIKD